MFTGIWLCVYIRREQESGLPKEIHMLTGDEVTQYATMDASVESLRHRYMGLVLVLQLLLTY